MKEQKMSIEQVRAMIEKMHASLEDLEKALNEGVLEGDEKWMFPEGNYTVLAIWLLYDPRAQIVCGERTEELGGTGGEADKIRRMDVVFPG